MNKKKGIIIAPGQIISRHDGSMTFNKLESSDINFLLLYWDKVVISTNNILHLEVPREKTLRELMAADFPRAIITEDDYPNDEGRIQENLFIKAQYKIAEKISQDDHEKFDWSLNQISNSPDLVIPEAYTKQALLLKMDFMQLLPSPGNLTTYEDVLEFKEKRGDLLNELHSHIEGICMEIMQSPDAAKERTKAIIEFEKNINDIHKVSFESFGITKKRELSIYLNINHLSLAAAGAAAISGLHFFPDIFHPLETIGVAAGCLLKIDCKYGISFSSKNDYKYIKQASNRNLLSK